MTKLFTTTALCLLLVTAATGQSLKNKEAKQILQAAFTALQTNDSASFVKLWHFDGKAGPYQKQEFNEQTALSYFHYMQSFLDTALTLKLEISSIEVERLRGNEKDKQFGKYNVKAWCQYNDTYFKGFGLYLDYIDHKWMVKYVPDTSTLVKA